MPQFLPENFLPQLFWLAVIFAVLYFFVVRPTLPKVGRVMEQREGQVSGDLDAAETAKGEADAIRARYDEGMAQARETAQSRVAAARAEAARAAEARLKDAGSRIDADAAAAAERLAATRAKARDGLRATTGELAAEAVNRLTGMDIAPADVAAALK